MSKVYIEGMEMPESCLSCPLRIDGHMEEYCAYTHLSIWKNYKDRNEFCPLKE